MLRLPRSGVRRGRSLHFEPSLGALNLRSDLIRSMKILSLDNAWRVFQQTSHSRLAEVAAERGLCYRGTSLIKNSAPLGPYSRTVPRALRWSWGGGAVSYERGTPVTGPPRNIPSKDTFTSRLFSCSEDPTVGLHLGSYGGPRGGGLFPMSEVPLQ